MPGIDFLVLNLPAPLSRIQIYHLLAYPRKIRTTLERAKLGPFSSQNIATQKGQRESLPRRGSVRMGLSLAWSTTASRSGVGACDTGDRF